MHNIKHERVCIYKMYCITILIIMKCRTIIDFLFMNIFILFYLFHNFKSHHRKIYYMKVFSWPQVWICKSSHHKRLWSLCVCNMFYSTWFSFMTIVHLRPIYTGKNNCSVESHSLQVVSLIRRCSWRLRSSLRHKMRDSSMFYCPNRAKNTLWHGNWTKATVSLGKRDRVEMWGGVGCEPQGEARLRHCWNLWVGDSHRSAGHIRWRREIRRKWILPVSSKIESGPTSDDSVFDAYTVLNERLSNTAFAYFTSCSITTGCGILNIATGRQNLAFRTNALIYLWLLLMFP